MQREFLLPDIGEGLAEAEIVRWLVDEGDSVAADEPIVEVETDKAVVEIPSPYAGVVLRHGGAPGDVIEVGSVLVVIGDEAESESQEPEQSAASFESDAQPVEESVATSSTEESVQPSDGEPHESDDGGATSPFAPATSPAQAAPIVGSLSEEAERLAPRFQPAPQTPAKVKALPVVRKLARDNDLDLAEIKGTGPDGRITRDDVERAIEDRSAAATREPTEPKEETTVSARPAESASTEDQTQKMSRLRRTIADNMSRSWSEIPHVTTFDDVDAARLLETRAALSSRHGRKVPIEALVVKAVVPALEAHPEFNATLDDENLVMHGSHDIGIAVDTQDGLLVAVIKEASSKSLMDLADEVVRLGEAAKERKLSPDELTGQTFTVSNIGAVGGGHGTPIVPYGTTAILSVGRARDQVVVDDGELVIAPIMPLSLSYDHRVIDGAVGRRFMALLMENLSEPALFLAT